MFLRAMMLGAVLFSWGASATEPDDVITPIPGNFLLERPAGLPSEYRASMMLENAVTRKTYRVFLDEQASVPPGKYWVSNDGYSQHTKLTVETSGVTRFRPFAVYSTSPFPLSRILYEILDYFPERSVTFEREALFVHLAVAKDFRLYFRNYDTDPISSAFTTEDLKFTAQEWGTKEALNIDERAVHLQLRTAGSAPVFPDAVPLSVNGDGPTQPFPRLPARIGLPLNRYHTEMKLWLEYGLHGFGRVKIPLGRSATITVCRLDVKDIPLKDGSEVRGVYRVNLNGRRILWNKPTGTGVWLPPGDYELETEAKAPSGETIHGAQPVTLTCG